jgi:ankyrin repeat protein
MKAKITRNSFKNNGFNEVIFLENKNIDTALDLRPPLHQAVKLGEEERVRTLLESKNTEIDRRDGFNETPLYIAVQTGKINIVQLLIDAGANLNATNRLEDTALHKAVFTEDLPAAKVLLKAGAKVNVKNNWNQTPLHFATIIGNPQIVKLLLNAGADKNAINKSGKTPFHIAKQQGNVELLELLSNTALYNVSEEGETTILLEEYSLEKKIENLTLAGTFSLDNDVIE